MALNRKIAYIDLTTGDTKVKPIPLDVRKKFLGGRGLDAYLLYNHTKKGCDPLGPDNALIISGGILTATCASATARAHFMAKSPLTGMLGSANMGGFFGPELAWAGFHHLVIKGKAKNPYTHSKCQKENIVPLARCIGCAVIIARVRRTTSTHLVTVIVCRKDL